MRCGLGFRFGKEMRREGKDLLCGLGLDSGQRETIITTIITVTNNNN